MVTMPDSVSKRVNFLVRGPPFDPFFSVIMDEMQISVLPKNSEKIIGCQNIFYGYQLHIHYVVPVKSTVEISQNFVAFSEYMNFIFNSPKKLYYYGTSSSIVSIRFFFFEN